MRIHKLAALALLATVSSLPALAQSNLPLSGTIGCGRTVASVNMQA